MVLQKRIYYGFNGFQVPFLPRGPRSARRKRSSSRRAARDYMCAFELLASVADKLLIEKHVKEEQLGEEKTNPIITKLDPSDDLASVDEFERQSTVTVDAKPPLLSSESSADKPLPPVYRDDDEKSSGCTQPAGSLRVEEGETMPSVSSRLWKFPQRCAFKRRKLFEDAHRGNYSGNVKTESLKVGIKSFKVPELTINVPETATVGSLKRTVVEAVTAILCGGFRVGIQLQGKKLRDDGKTLTQAGISHGGGVQSLSFALEPDAPLTPNTETILPDGSDPHRASCHADMAGVDDVLYSLESEQDSAPSPEDVHGGALALVPAAEMEALAMVPYRRRLNRRGEAGPRRIRRPFSVCEVEALVRAVEKLGTGRWRDVKMCAFEDARHRTYVDLKDKWKTLVHTAKISPQQRRGEPVPQELLDRVLAANAYWSHLHAKRPARPDPLSPPLLA